jgi:hypothetical protein
MEKKEVEDCVGSENNRFIYNVNMGKIEMEKRDGK